MIRTFAAIISAVSLFSGASGAAAQSYDMDCKVILCMAGGFPAGCGDAYTYMIDRITDFPNPKPPFGTCSQSDGTAYRGADADYAYLKRGTPAGWVCPSTHIMKFNGGGGDNNQNSGSATCYTSISTKKISGDETQTVYHNRVPAKNVTFKVQLTIDGGTPAEYKSPVYRLNYKTGFVTPTLGG